MSEYELGTGGHGCGDDVAAYVLGALDAAEAAVFETHLETCAICRDELAAFEQVVGALPMSAPAYRAPRRVRRRVLAAVAADARARSGAATAAPSRRLRPAWRPRLAGAAGLVAAAALAAVLLLPGTGSAPVRTIAAQVTGISGQAELRVSGGHGELIVRNLTAPPAGEIYEVWLKRPGRPPAPTSALFSVNRRGAGDADVPGDLHGVSLIMVTPEPAGGSRVPTHPAVISAQLT